MKLITNTQIKGYRRNKEGVQDFQLPIVHAKAGDTLQVLFLNQLGYTCLSKYHEDVNIHVFFSQVKDTLKENSFVDLHEDEKFYQVYEEPSKQSLDDPFYSESDNNEGILE